MTDRLRATYRVKATAASIEARAKGIAVEQSVEMPLSAIDDPAVLDGIVGVVEEITERGEDCFEVRLALSTATIGGDAGQLFNMLFGNTSLQDDTVLLDIDLPDDLLASFGGPNIGAAGLRARVGASADRALTCSALKPQGLPPDRLADLARRMALGGLDFIKDDHGMADQAYAPFASRVGAVAAAVDEVNRQTGGQTRYLPSLSGHLDQLRSQVRTGLDHGIDTFLIAPMIVGPSTFHAVVREFPGAAFFAHPTLAGPSRIAPPAHFGKLFRLLGADAVIFPNSGGRFGYSRDTCQAVAEAALGPWGGLHASLPVPAGGMSLARVPEMIATYGPDVIVLIGGNLLEARDRLTEETAAFVASVAGAASRGCGLAP
ncbi:5-methylthioribulose-1-phosphate isomerase [Rhodospirillum rubrum]|uniref:5-methylthioribulose-1-phosphate isomerase n=1 Tax=Rhodospirillum rubrum (strain ATCC 11170 / ATH 1.1.1 / DSM 467 / LMG 4362 / NCIMB 8255 / S1) TaxID=269796 RepID=RLP_RHORT|nr:5-methylthioribulose-1-phosphate isomerase [Rhodospirillum rubrum]Q2RSU7.1 RecName: Full=5-methylthioribulose-1-phosphate isomerase [Rhodospirillum rubrum ATCC 11170]ABC22798.1 ribulose-1,5-bisphosphate carboxylase/oxygenase large subunit [Rhodospirillum rubrum ATCC 11170]AEO48519.1 ribulose 1,5-bisphosphate carboxylase large subunit [Rhodospirillum rubrum F11]MBK5954395.1 ribulose 1,5-bisphosphate carboxylase [Rhodospirillum rubrum]QXG78787.1 ribulose 1,5-bisphosphate carboxylase [Rhodospi